MIAILDYGAGNLRSVQNTLDEIGASYAAGARLPKACTQRRRSFCPASATSAR